jgi:PilZ domain
MPNKERRLAPRKAALIPIRFRIFSHDSHNLVATTVEAATTAGIGREVQMRQAPAALLDLYDGQAVNLSERGIYFKSPEALMVGDSVEMFFTLPQELTGRRSEEVRCNARVVHVDRNIDAQGSIGAGATVERFEPINRVRSWAN